MVKMKKLITLIFLIINIGIYSQNKLFEIGKIEGDSTFKPQRIRINLKELVEKQIPQLGLLQKTKYLETRRPNNSKYDNKCLDSEIMNNGFSEIDSYNEFEFLKDGTILFTIIWNGRLLLLNIGGDNYTKINNWCILTHSSLDTIKEENYYYIENAICLNRFTFYHLNNKYYLINQDIAISMNSDFTNFNYQYLKFVWQKIVPPCYQNKNSEYIFKANIFWDSTFRFDFGYDEDDFSNMRETEVDSLREKARFYVELSKDLEPIKYFKIHSSISLIIFKKIINYNLSRFSVNSYSIFYSEVMSKFLSDSLNHSKEYKFDDWRFKLVQTDSAFNIINTISSKIKHKLINNTPIGDVFTKDDNTYRLSSDITGEAGFNRYHGIWIPIYNPKYHNDTMIAFRIPNLFYRSKRFLYDETEFLKCIVFDQNNLNLVDYLITIYKIPYLKSINNNSYNLEINNSENNSLELKLSTNGFLSKIAVEIFSKHQDGNKQERKSYYPEYAKIPTFKGKSAEKYTFRTLILNLDSVCELKLKRGTHYCRIRPEYKSNYIDYIVSARSKYYNKSFLKNDWVSLIKNEEYYFLKLIRMPHNENEIIEYAFKIKIRRFGKPKITKIKLKKNENYE